MPHRSQSLTMAILFNRPIPLPVGTPRVIQYQGDDDTEEPPRFAIDCCTHGKRQRAKILALLEDGGRYASELVDEMQITASSIKRHMVMLEAEGKVKRTGHHRNGKPRIFFELTDQGDSQ